MSVKIMQNDAILLSLAPSLNPIFLQDYAAGFESNDRKFKISHHYKICFQLISPVKGRFGCNLYTNLREEPSSAA